MNKKKGPDAPTPVQKRAKAPSPTPAPSVPNSGEAKEPKLDLPKPPYQPQLMRDFFGSGN
jgi:hypothetical protein